MDKIMLTTAGKKELLDIKKNQGEGNNDEESFAGCTANVSLIVDGVLYVANAGDSRTLMCSNGKPVPMSVDHKPDDDLEY
jgi:serine/threonine protein phosphatase PrpC